MSFDPHERAQFLIDESRIAGISPEDTAWLRSHLAECPACARHEEETTRILAAMSELSFGRTVDHFVPSGQRPKAAAWRWLLAAAAAVLLAAIPLYKAREARQEQADALLLERVSTHVSRTVPQALEPLMNPEPGGQQ
jgi:hypothetical protein